MSSQPATGGNQYRYNWLALEKHWSPISLSSPYTLHYLPHTQNSNQEKGSSTPATAITTTRLSALCTVFHFKFFTMYRHSSYQSGTAKHIWQDGDIAFLKNYKTFLEKDHRDLIASGYLHRGATNHPVILLQAGSGRAIVTTVTAFNSGAETNFCPPWRMPVHRHKHLDDFHAFTGTELPPNSRHSHLQLCDPGAKMNKPQASWVYIKHFFTVPYTVLLRWNKVPQQLAVSKESLTQLRADIERKYSVQLRDSRSRLTTGSRAAVSNPRQSTSQTRHIHQPSRAHRSCPTPHKHDEIPKPVELAPSIKSSALGPQHSIRGKDVAWQTSASQKPSWSQVASMTSTPIRPKMACSLSCPTAA